jgi:hypothetical protein
MGVDTHMIAGVRACLTFPPDRSSPAIQTTPHYAEALARQRLIRELRARPAGAARHRGRMWERLLFRRPRPAAA